MNKQNPVEQYIILRVQLRQELAAIEADLMELQQRRDYLHQVLNDQDAELEAAVETAIEKRTSAQPVITVEPKPAGKKSAAKRQTPTKKTTTKRVPSKASNSASEKLTDESLLSFIAGSPGASRQDVRTFIGNRASENTQKSMLARLRDAGLIENQGTKRDSAWHVVKN